MNLLFIATQELIIIFLVLTPFLYTAYHAITNKNLTTYQRSLWILITVLGNLLGWLLYWAIGKNGDTRSRQRGMWVDEEDGEEGERK